MTNSLQHQTTSENPPNLDPFSGTGTYQLNSYQRTRIQYPRASQIENKIEYCRVASKATSEPHCLLIIGESGVGKTSLIQEYLAKHSPRDVSGGTVVPVLFSPIPTPATIKEMVAYLLHALGNPVPTTGTTAKMTLHLLELLEKCRVELVILDEFQHFIEQKNAKGLKEVSEWLKTFINMAKIPVILVGMPDCRDILLSNSQLMRRFSAQMHLKPFAWSGENKREFIRFLEEIAPSLPLKEKPKFGDLDLAQRIFWATEGRAGRIFKLIHGATEKALDAGLDSLSMEVLSESYSETLSAFYRDEADPFLGPLPEIDWEGKPVRAVGLDASEPNIVIGRPPLSPRKGSAAKEFAKSMSSKAGQ